MHGARLINRQTAERISRVTVRWSQWRLRLFEAVGSLFGLQPKQDPPSGRTWELLAFDSAKRWFTWLGFTRLAAWHLLIRRHWLADNTRTQTKWVIYKNNDAKRGVYRARHTLHHWCHGEIGSPIISEISIGPLGLVKHRQTDTFRQVTLSPSMDKQEMMKSLIRSSQLIQPFADKGIGNVSL